MIDFTVIIHINADENFLHRCLRSVISQSLFGRKFEVILVGPGDYTSYERAFEKYIPIKSLSYKDGINFNKIILASAGRFISILNSSDYISDHLFFTQLLTLHDNIEIQGVYCNYILVDLNENKLMKLQPRDEHCLFGIMVRVEAVSKLLKNENASSIKDVESLLDSLRRNLDLILLPISFYRKLV